MSRLRRIGRPQGIGTAGLSPWRDPCSLDDRNAERSPFRRLVGRLPCDSLRATGTTGAEWPGRQRSSSGCQRAYRRRRGRQQWARRDRQRRRKRRGHRRSHSQRRRRGWCRGRRWHGADRVWRHRGRHRPPTVAARSRSAAPSVRSSAVPARPAGRHPRARSLPRCARAAPRDSSAPAIRTAILCVVLSASPRRVDLTRPPPRLAMTAICAIATFPCVTRPSDDAICSQLGAQPAREYANVRRRRPRCRRRSSPPADPLPRGAPRGGGQERL